MRMPLHPAKNQITLPGVLFALSDPTRLKIVRAIAGTDGLNCCDIPLELSKSTASRHFKVLRDAGVIRMDPHGVVCINSLRRQELDELFPGLIDSVLAALDVPPPDGAARRRSSEEATNLTREARAPSATDSILRSKGLIDPSRPEA